MTARCEFEEYYEILLERRRAGRDPSVREAHKLRRLWEAAQREHRGPEAPPGHPDWHLLDGDPPPPWEVVAAALDLDEIASAEPANESSAKPPRVSRPGPPRKQLPRATRDDLDELLARHAADPQEWSLARIQRELGLSYRQVARRRNQLDPR